MGREVQWGWGGRTTTTAGMAYFSFAALSSIAIALLFLSLAMARKPRWTSVQDVDVLTQPSKGRDTLWAKVGLRWLDMPLCLMHDAKAPSASGLIVFGCCNEAGTVFGEASGVLGGLFCCHSMSNS